MPNTLSAENEARLLEIIAQAGYGAVEELIVENATECIALLLDEPDEYVQVGNARYGGVPDLPPGLEWPRDDYGKYLSFLMQVPLAEVPPIVGNPLPKQGMLYCFHGDDGDTVSGEGCRILYADVTKDVLKRAEAPDDDELSIDYYAGLKPYRLMVETKIDLPEWTSEAQQQITDELDELSEELSDNYNNFARGVRCSEKGKLAGKLLGQPAWIGYVPDEGISASAGKTDGEWFLLWLLDSRRPVGATYGDAGYLQVYARRSAIARGNFEETITELESS
jgi:uncharacterized protein YwqG